MYIFHMAFNNFSWVLPQKLAGSDIPGRNGTGSDAARNDLQWLKSQGICTLVSLERPKGLFEQLCSETGLQWNFFPIPDYDVPEKMKDFVVLVSNIIKDIKDNKPVCVHCHAGIGRTGLVLSCIMGMYFQIDARMAIASVRQSRSALDTVEQERFVFTFLEKYHES